MGGEERGGEVNIADARAGGPRPDCNNPSHPQSEVNIVGTRGSLSGEDDRQFSNNATRAMSWVSMYTHVNILYDSAYRQSDLWICTCTHGDGASEKNKQPCLIPALISLISGRTSI